MREYRVTGSDGKKCTVYARSISAAKDEAIKLLNCWPVEVNHIVDPKPAKVFRKFEAA
jgi:hypothetical protein